PLGVPGLERNPRGFHSRNHALRRSIGARMPSPSPRAEILGAIKQNIRRYGRHIYAIGGGPSPRFAYTIGMRESIGAELVLPGAAFFDLADVQGIITPRADLLGGETGSEAALALDRLGAVTLRRAHQSWVQRLLLGALDYYNLR